jgi:hypothetical protein
MAIAVGAPTIRTFAVISPTSITAMERGELQDQWREKAISVPTR